MVTPTADNIREEALRLFFTDNPSATTPEDYELKESGYWQTARDSLMRGESAEALGYLEQMANELGRRVVTEDEHSKLVDIELRLEKLREKEKRVKEAEKDIEARKRLLNSAEQLKSKIEHREVSEKVSKHKKGAKRVSGTCKARFLRACRRKHIPLSQCSKMAKNLCTRKKATVTLPAVPRV
jgi:hypothetical protein